MTAADTTQHTTAVLDTEVLTPAAAEQAAPHTQQASYAPAPQQVQETKPERSTSSSFAITSFVLGIASIISSWTFVAPIIGLVFGVLALRRGTQERTLALWGVWLNGVMLAVTALITLGFIAVAGLGILGGLASGAWYYN